MIDFAQLTNFLNSLQSYSQDMVQNLGPNDKLCHYTTLEGAIGIIRGDDLWLTSSRYSNDDGELGYGYALVDSVLDKLRTEAGATPRGDWLQKLHAEVRAARARDDQVYICCFCEKDNLLSQWRGYADNGGGVSIEFYPAGFYAVAGPDCIHGLMRLWKVFYKRDQQERIVRDCINYPHWHAANEEQKIPFVVDALQFFVPTFKSADFSEEQERRLIFTPQPGTAPKPRFRTRRGLLVPYYSLRDLSPGLGAGFRLPIREMLIGPSSHRTLNAQSARMLLASHGRAGVDVKESTTPYRA